MRHENTKEISQHKIYTDIFLPKGDARLSLTSGDAGYYAFVSNLTMRRNRLE